MKSFITISLIIYTFISSSFTSKLDIDFLGKEETKTVQVYPNPAVNFVIFDISNLTEKNLNLSIFNMLGKKVIEAKLTSIKTSFNTENLYRGIYIFQIKNKAGQVIEVGKFQVNR